jgi:hypothetical protein
MKAARANSGFDPMLTKGVRLFCLLSCANIRFFGRFYPATPISQILAYTTVKNFPYFWPILFETFFQFSALHPLATQFCQGTVFSPRFFQLQLNK